MTESLFESEGEQNSEELFCGLSHVFLNVSALLLTENKARES